MLGIKLQTDARINLFYLIHKFSLGGRAVGDTSCPLIQHLCGPHAGQTLAPAMLFLPSLKTVHTEQYKMKTVVHELSYKDRDNAIYIYIYLYA